MMWYYGADGLGWLWMVGLMLLFWIGVAVFAVWAVRTMTAARRSGDAALDVLRRRFASGEISAEEFEKTRKLLGA